MFQLLDIWENYSKINWIALFQIESDIFLCRLFSIAVGFLETMSYGFSIEEIQLL